MQITIWKIILFNIFHCVVSLHPHQKDYSKYSIIELEMFVENYENTPEFTYANCEILNQELHGKGEKLFLLCSEQDEEILKLE